MSGLDHPLLQRQQNLRGAATLSLAMGCLVVNDALVKWVGQAMPVAQVIWIRALFATLLLVAMAQLTGAWRAVGWVAVFHPRVPLRAALDALATFAYVVALAHLPIPSATAINMSAPLFVTLLGVWIFQERVPFGRWLVLGVGFFGVLLIVQPRSGDFNAYGLLCLAGTVLQASRDLCSRAISSQVPPLMVALATSLAILFLSTVLVTLQPWFMPSVQDVFLLFTASVFLSGGYYLTFVGMRCGEISAVAPFRYTGLLLALVLGWLVWGDIPTQAAWLGVMFQ